MLRLFLKIYFKSKLKQIPSWICIVIILIFLAERYIHPFTFVLFVSTYFLIFLLYLEIKEKKICSISDTKLNQQNYYDETGLEPFRKKKITIGYRRWLVQSITKNTRDVVETQFFPSYISYFCLLGFFGIVPIMILFMIISIYVAIPQTVVITSVVVISIIILCTMGVRRTINKGYKQIDSEIKRIIFEEETGYSPLIKGKYTSKYKAWLKWDEEKRRSVPYRI